MLGMRPRSDTRKLALASAVSIAALGVLTPGRSEAHFVLDQLPDGGVPQGEPASWMSQSANGAPQKTGPCGNEGGGTATKLVTAFQAGQMVSITVNEVVSHTGWYRVSLAEGPSSSQTLTSLPNPVVTTTCTPARISNPVWSSTQPVIFESASHGSQTLQVLLPPNVSCTTASPCTLQVVEVMTDHAPPPPASNNCFYHHCADITIAASARDDGGAGSSSSGGAGSSSSGGADASSDAGGSSGATGSSGSSGAGGSSGSPSSSSSSGSTGSSGAGASGSSSGAGGSNGSSGVGSGSSGAGQSSGGGGSGGAADAATTEAVPAGGGCSLIVATGGGVPAATILAGFVAVSTFRRRRRRR